MFRSEETETDLSIRIPTEICGIFGIMESTLGVSTVEALMRISINGVVSSEHYH